MYTFVHSIADRVLSFAWILTPHCRIKEQKGKPDFAKCVLAARTYLFFVFVYCYLPLFLILECVMWNEQKQNGGRGRGDDTGNEIDARLRMQCFANCKTMRFNTSIPKPVKHLTFWIWSNFELDDWMKSWNLPMRNANTIFWHQSGCIFLHTWEMSDI